MNIQHKGFSDFARLTSFASNAPDKLDAATLWESNIALENDGHLA